MHFSGSERGVGMSPKNRLPIAAIRTQKEGRSDWCWVGRDFPRAPLKPWADRCGLTAPDFRTQIPDKNASFSGHFERSGDGAGMDLETRHSYPRLWVGKGRSDSRRSGRDFPMIVRKSWTNRWELTVPSFRNLIADKHASFSRHFERSGDGWKWLLK